MPAALFLSPPPPFPSPQVRRRPRRNTLCTSSLLGVTSFVHNVLPLPHGCSSKCPHQYHLTPFLQPTNSNAPTPSPNRNEDTNEWVLALEELLLEALQTYYQGTPMFTDSEFQTLREELEHLGSAQIRLDAMEKVWVQATSSRDFDRRVRAEFEMSEDDLNALKNSLVRAGRVKRPIGKIDSRREDLSRFSLPPGRKLLNDAKRIDSTEPHQQGLQWLLFSDTSEERLKIILLYLPAVVMSFVTASVFTILFALLDGEMRITVTSAGRFRLGILSYVVVLLTYWFSNQVTPVMLDYLDLGRPSLLRAECPMCGSSVSCLFTGAVRNRDERICSVCGATVGFNRKWNKSYLVSPPDAKKYQDPD